jgi:mono/diheme cytochrome c family protein
MELHKHLTALADKDSLPPDHTLRVTANALRDALSRKGEPGFPDRLFEAETDALAAYAAYTGKVFVNPGEED